MPLYVEFNILASALYWLFNRKNECHVHRGLCNRNIYIYIYTIYNYVQNLAGNKKMAGKNHRFTIMQCSTFIYIFMCLCLSYNI